jgi:tRNA(fMet)-specific endonuclease VapC
LIYLLDTNACIRILDTRQGLQVATRLAAVRPEDVALCTVVQAELYYGAERSTQRESNLRLLQEFFIRFASLPFDEPSARVYGRIRAELAARGTPIGPNDLQIAAIALANSLVLVTHNSGEFSRVSGLQTEDWEQEA